MSGREGLGPARSDAQLAFERLDAQQKQLIALAFATQLRTREGRMFVRWLLGVTRWNEPAMTGNSQTFFVLGQQDVGRQIRAALAGADLAGWRALEDEIQADAVLAASLKSPD